MPLEKRCGCAKGKRGDDRERAWARCGHEWQIRFELRGKRVRESATTTSRREAEGFERDRRAYYERTTPARPSGRADVATLADLDLERAEADGVTEAQLDWLAYAWEQIGRHLGGTSPCTVITYDRVEQYIKARLADGVSGDTVRRERQRLAWAAGVAHRKGWLPLLPASWPKVKGTPKNAQRSGKLHPAPVLRRWFRELRRRHRLAYLEARLIVLTGLRETEATRCAAEWVTEIGGRPFLHVPAWAAKKRKARRIGLGREALFILQHLARGKAAAEPLIGKRYLKKQRVGAARAFGSSRTIHKRDLRHTFSTLGMEATGDAAAVMMAQGHADLEQTAEYQHSTLDRALAVSHGVEKKLAQPPPQNRHASYNASFGRGDWIRTSDPLTPSQVQQLARHVKACDSCRRRLAECAEVPLLHPETATPHRHRVRA